MECYINREAVDTEGLDTGGKSEICLEVGEWMGWLQVE